jgi:hypothetical protein
MGWGPHVFMVNNFGMPLQMRRKNISSQLLHPHNIQNMQNADSPCLSTVFHFAHENS